MKSVLTLTPFYSPNVGGVETHLDDLTAFLQKNGFWQTIITYQPLTAPKIKAPFRQKGKNLVIYRLYWPKFNLFYKLESKPILQFPYLATGIFFLGFFYLLFNSKKIKIIHAHGLATMVAGFFLSKIFNIRFVVGIHTIYKFSQRPALASIINKFLIKAEAITVLAKGAKDDLVSVGIPAEKIFVYTNWIDLQDKYFPKDKLDCRREVNLPEKDFIALFVARLSPEKGVKLLLETIAKTPKSITFGIIGGGPMKSQVEAVAAKYSNVRYIGPVSPAVLPIYLNAADVLFWGSVDEDYFGRITMSALGCGRPVLIPSKTEYFGKLRPVEIDFPQGKIGYMLEPDSEVVAEKLSRLPKEDLKQMGENARRYALAHFSEKNARVFLKVYFG